MCQLSFLGLSKCSSHSSPSRSRVHSARLAEAGTSGVARWGPKPRSSREARSCWLRCLDDLSSTGTAETHRYPHVRRQQQEERPGFSGARGNERGHGGSLAVLGPARRLRATHTWKRRPPFQTLPFVTCLSVLITWWPLTLRLCQLAASPISPSRWGTVGFMLLFPSVPCPDV